MPAEQKQAIASAYFASDKVIYAVRDDGAATGVRVDSVSVSDSSVPDDQKMDADLKSAANGILALLAKDEQLRAVVLICPGPFRTIDKGSPLYGFIGRNAEVRYWRSKNAIAIFRKHLIEALDPERANCVAIYIYNQAGATAVGEYLSIYGDQIRYADAPGAMHKLIGNHLFVVADVTIDAALISDGEPFHGLSPMDVGHHAVIPVDEDDETLERLQCPTHPERPCLNSLASLDAIEKRWPEMDYENFKACKDTDKISHIAFYIAQMLANVTLSMSPTRIVLGGRIAHNPLILPILKEHLEYLLRDNENPEIYPGYQNINEMEDFIIGQGDGDSGVKGGLHVLARILIKKHDSTNIASFEAYKKGLYPL